jgi:hypothetical protein
LIIESGSQLRDTRGGDYRVCENDRANPGFNVLSECGGILGYQRGNAGHF